MSLHVPFWRCPPRCRSNLRTGALCCLGVAVLVVNLYLLHTSPSRWLHAHGGVLPRRFGLSGWASHPLCHPRLLPAQPPGVVTALASVPGSGNTWVRHLLQQATGLMTGSMYNDAFIKSVGFPGEGVNNGSVLVVKTHEGHADVRRHFRRAVLLVRHPRDAILAEFNRLHGGHLGHASPKDFEESWESFAPDALNYWTAFNTEWLQFTGPLHIVHFEDFQLNLNTTLKKLLTFLNASVSCQDFECALQNSSGKFKRRKKRTSDGVTEGDIFTPEMTKRLAKSEENFRTALNNYTRKLATRTVT